MAGLNHTNAKQLAYWTQSPHCQPSASTPKTGNQIHLAKPWERRWQQRSPTNNKPPTKHDNLNQTKHYPNNTKQPQAIKKHSQVQG
jgi:hypothetical protein